MCSTCTCGTSRPACRESDVWGGLLCSRFVTAAVLVLQAACLQLRFMTLSFYTVSRLTALTVYCSLSVCNKHVSRWGSDNGSTASAARGPRRVCPGNCPVVRRRSIWLVSFTTLSRTRTRRHAPLRKNFGCEIVDCEQGVLMKLSLSLSLSLRLSGGWRGEGGGGEGDRVTVFLCFM